MFEQVFALGRGTHQGRQVGGRVGEQEGAEALYVAQQGTHAIQASGRNVVQARHLKHNHVNITMVLTLICKLAINVSLLQVL